MPHAPVIAIVDDDPSVRRSLRRLVQSAGYRVQTFASAGAFLDALPGNRTACLVLDVHLDGMNGFDLQERRRRRVRGCRSSSSRPMTMPPPGPASNGRGRPATWKPFDDVALLDAIRRVVGLLDEGPIGSPGSVD